MDLAKLINDLYDTNPGIDLLLLDLHSEHVVNSLKLPKGTAGAQKASIVEHLKEVRRLVRLHPKATGSPKPLTANDVRQIYKQFGKIKSAHEIVRQSKDVFVRENAQSFNSEDIAASVYRNALAVVNNVANLTAAIHNMTSPLSKATIANSISEDVTNYFQGLPGYEELFGSLNYCDCCECKSVLGPAAYLVDLLRIIQKYVTEENKYTIPAKMLFEYRRDDIPFIDLTCEETNTIISYLDVINARLEATLEKLWNTGHDPAALYKKVAATYYPFNLPYLLPLSDIRIYLGFLKTTLADVYSALQVTGNALVMEQLCLSLESWNLLITAATDGPKLQECYGVKDYKALSEFSIFAEQTGLTAIKIEDLFYQDLSDAEIKNGLNKQFFINKSLANPVMVDNDGKKNILKNLDPVALDQINRFLRFSAQLKWSYTDTDWALHALGDGTPDISKTTLSQFPALQQLINTMGGSVMDACNLIFDLKTYGKGDDPASSGAPFDAVFNTGQKIPYHPKNSETDNYPLNSTYKEKPWVWQTDSQKGDNPRYATRVASALGISQNDLTVLTEAIFDPKAAVILNVPNISALYRHALLAGRLKLPISEYLTLLRLNNPTVKLPAIKLFTIDQAMQLFNSSAYLASAGLTVYDADYIVNAIKNPTVDILYHDGQMTSWLETLPKLITSAASSPKDKEAEMRSKLFEQVASFFGTQPSVAEVILSLVVSDPLPVFLDKDCNKEAGDAIIQLSRWLVFIKKIGLSNSVLMNIQSHPSAYDVKNTASLSFDNILTIISFRNIISGFGDVNDRFIKYIAALNNSKLGEASQILSEATGWNKDDINALAKQLKFSSQVSGLGVFGKVFDLLAATGLNFSSFNDLKLIAGKGLQDWDLLAKTEQMLLTSVQARYNTGGSWDQLLVQINGKAGASKRDAIIAATINALHNNSDTSFVKNARDLHDYLLIDVEISESAQISYIKEALNAAQLYLSRCRLKLEPGVEKLPIPDVWWEWMMNYCVWQANREIFLYPENYIDPAYRSTKTSLFRQLENDLKQNDITDENATTAYMKYLEGFALLANLVYVDAYYCKISDDTHNDQPTLFLFARTATEPYSYYYIVRESEGTWSEWAKIDLAINSAYITPVYAFNRLFLFWVEQSTTVEKTPDKKTETIVKASINYTFHNYQKQWVSAQSLVKDYVITAEPSPYRTSNIDLFPDRYFNPGSLWWNKVYPINIKANSYWEITGGANRFEHLVIAFGPMIDTAVPVKLPQEKDKPGSDNKLVQRFENNLYKVRQEYSYLIGLKDHVGQLPICPPFVLNDQLDKVYLANPREILFLKADMPNCNQLFTPQIDAASGRLNLINTNRTIYDNDNAEQILSPAAPVPPGKLNLDSFISTSAGIDKASSSSIFAEFQFKRYINQSNTLVRGDFAALRLDFEALDHDKVVSIMSVVNTVCGTRWLSENFRNKNCGLFSIKNAPGVFVFFGDKEAFLFEDPKIDPVFISEHLFNAETLPLNSESFISVGAGVDKEASNKIFGMLTESGHLSRDGLPKGYSTLEELRTTLIKYFNGQPGPSHKADIVIDILANTVAFQDTAFISMDPPLSAEDSRQIYNALIVIGFLDKNGRLTAGINFNNIVRVLTPIFSNNPAIVRHVTDKLRQQNCPTSIGFFHSVSAAHYSCEYNFGVTRLTTRSIHHLSARIFSGGIDKLLSLDSQLIPVEPELPFSRFGFEAPYVRGPEAIDGAQVDFKGAYEIYYWELFFHAPMYIAALLKTNQAFDKAEKWYKYIFDPTAQARLINKDSFETSTLGADSSQVIYKKLLEAKLINEEGYVGSLFTKQTDLSGLLADFNEVQRQSVKNILLNHQMARDVCRVWQFNPFRNQNLSTILENIVNEKQIDAYNQYPLDPDAIARLRIGGYEKAVVMQYVDNLVKWGDKYFSQYTWESITTANLLYNYAYNLLGPKPEDLGACSSEAPANFAAIVKKYGDKIPQFKIALEDQINTGSTGLNFQPYNDIDAYFCVPGNSNLEQYWDTVADRFYKINHCLNIAGEKQQLPLFEPPLDPALLARAAGSGGNPQSLFNQSGNLIAYRFDYLIERAKSLASSLSQLGSSLLSALERKDESALQRLQATQQSVILNLTTLIKEKQIDQARQNIAGLQQNLLEARNREQCYLDNYNQNLSGLEISSLAVMNASLYPESVSMAIIGTSIAGYLLPNIFGFSDGGMDFGGAINAGAQIAQTASAILNQTGGIISTTAQYARRRDDWLLQKQTASYQAAEIQKQLDASSTALAMAQHDLAIHKKTIEQQNEYENYLKTKFTNADLYVWMISRLSSIYVQTYQLALDMALAAQSAYQNEMDNSDPIIQFDCWDSLRKGLLAGEGLTLSLEQMEKAYSVANHRRFEIEKTVSLLHLDPVNFVGFKTGLHGVKKGTLAFELSEQLFDFDFPGHYCRKIKTISVSIPAVVGPYQNINATLKQISNIIVMEDKIDAARYAADPNNNGKPKEGYVRENWIPNQKIALSKGVDDDGMFVLNFNDSMYLPFEGTGAVSKWELSLPPETNHFNFNSISDIIVKISYTALDGGGTFPDDVRKFLHTTKPPYPYRIGKQFILQQAFSSAWQQFMHPSPNPKTQAISFQLTDAIILPNLQDVTLLSAMVFILTKDNLEVSNKTDGSQTGNKKDIPFLSFKKNGEAPLSVPIRKNFGKIDLSGTVEAALVTLEFTIANTPVELLTADRKQLDPEKFIGMIFLLNYTSNVFKK